MTTGTTDGIGTLRRLAAERHGDPFAALPQIEALLALPPGDVDLVGRALWIRGLLLHELARPAEAIRSFREAVTWSQLHGLADVEARARANLAITLTHIGETATAALELEAARRLAPDSARGLVTYLSSLYASRRGLQREAIDGYDAALPQLLAVDDQATAGVLRLNRGVAHIYFGDFDAAYSDLAAAERVAVEQQLVILAAMASHNLGFLEGRRGNLADALLRLDRAVEWYQQVEGKPRQLPVLLSDRAEMLLVAGLASDAQEAAARAVEELTEAGNRADLTEAQLLLARACLAADEYERAKAAALEAARGFRSSRRPAWATHADYVGRQADFEVARAEDRPTLALAPRFARLADRLAHHGWPVEAKDAFVYGALSAAPTDPALARRLVVQARRIPATGAAPFRSRWHHALALTALARGDVRNAARSVRTGVRDVSTVMASTGSTEATLASLRYAGELGQVGIEIAADTGRVVDLLHAVERQRSLASMLPSARPRRAELGDALTQLRQAATHDVGERQLRERALRTAGATPGTDPFTWQALRANLADRTIVYFVEIKGRLMALVVTARGTRVVELGLVEEAVRLQEFSHFALTSFAFTPDDRAIRATERLWRDVSQLDQLLVAHLKLTSSAVTLVPSRGVEGVLWSLLPSLRETDTSIAPSAASWLAASQREAPSTGRIVLVAGPGLAAADREVALLRDLYPDAMVFIGEDARVGEVLAALEAADLVHIAAHGLFRSDSPMFSRVELADGPLTVYDLEQLGHPPRTVVLSACEAAAARYYRSGGALGTARALLSIGSSTVVAALLAVEDEATRDHMVCLHQHLATGSSVARAMRLATQEAFETGHRRRVASAGSFITIGAG